MVIRHWNPSRGREIGDFYAVPACEIGYWLMGNRDCRHSDPQGMAVQTRFLELVRKYARGNVGPIPQPQAPGGLSQAGQAIITGVKDTITGIVGGAATGAASASQSAGAASQASQQLTQLLPLLLVGAVVFLILRK
jgi:hypothetical protein